MKLAVSNIAWLPEERFDAYTLMQKHNVKGLEIAPSILFYDAEDPFVPSAESANRALTEIESFNLRLVSMQSLLFGIQDAALFGSASQVASFKTAMQRAIDIGHRFSIPNLVFGCPKQRIIPDGLPYADAEKLASEIFNELGDYAQAAKTVIAMETNPSAYGTNFMTNMRQTIDFVALTSHPAIKINMDMGALYMNDDYASAEGYIQDNVNEINHVHISESNLEPAPRDIELTANILRALARCDYPFWTSIEMKKHPVDNISNLESCLIKFNSAIEFVNSSPAKV